MASDSPSQVDVPELLDTLFKDVTEPNPSEESSNLRLYPETILQKSQKGNKLYASFQRHSPQFINDVDGVDKKQILRWRDSNIESAQRIVLNSWIAQNSGMGSTTSKDTKLSKTVTTTGRANKLFVWSSSDAYIEEKKRQLQLRKVLENKSSEPAKPSVENEEKPVEADAELDALQNHLHLKLTTDKINNKLSRRIEVEANRFIHARMQKIRDHHSEQMMKQINERKRKDHEVYLQRLKIKEEEYEKSIRQDQDQVGTKKSNFFETLFGLGGSMSPSGDHHSSFDADGTPPATPKDSTKSSKSKRTNLFGMQSLFSSSNASKKRVDKTIMFDAEDKSDTQSIANSTMSTNEEPKKDDANTPTVEDSSRDTNIKKHEISAPLFNVDELESLGMKQSPQKSSGPSTSNRDSPKRGTTDADDFDDEFTEFTEFTGATPEYNSVSSPPSRTPVPKLSHNFFSVEKANANGTPALTGNELIDLFDTNESRSASQEITSPTPSQLQTKMNNLLDL
ncbi:hypothetical protein I9W82_004127 [Candida metapsilosis]|uniref:Uncharacterized protein n=1 Tax=Candida metapsilosis TaxID=273372 RepID=A0A8H7ZDL4_9ASCO|nr:hypothetical protein I9W82_004127 [Candida metapsilosis]